MLLRTKCVRYTLVALLWWDLHPHIHLWLTFKISIWVRACQPERLIGIIQRPSVAEFFWCVLRISWKAASEQEKTIWICFVFVYRTCQEELSREYFARARFLLWSSCRQFKSQTTQKYMYFLFRLCVTAQYGRHFCYTWLHVSGLVDPHVFVHFRFLSEPFFSSSDVFAQLISNFVATGCSSAPFQPVSQDAHVSVLVFLLVHPTMETDFHPSCHASLFPQYAVQPSLSSCPPLGAVLWHVSPTGCSATSCKSVAETNFAMWGQRPF